MCITPDFYGRRYRKSGSYKIKRSVVYYTVLLKMWSKSGLFAQKRVFYRKKMKKKNYQEIAKNDLYFLSSKSRNTIPYNAETSFGMQCLLVQVVKTADINIYHGKNWF